MHCIALYIYIELIQGNRCIELHCRLERTERMMVRWMCGVTLKDRVASAELNSRLHIECITDIVKRGRLRWFGHVERKDRDDWVSACRRIEVK